MPLGIPRCLPRLASSLPRHVVSQKILPARRISTATSILPDDIYDIIVVGGGIAGLALTTSLRTLSLPQLSNDSIPRHVQEPQNCFSRAQCSQTIRPLWPPCKPLQFSHSQLNPISTRSFSTEYPLTTRYRGMEVYQ